MARLINRHKINDAAALLKAGELVAFPTETVYGLGADATNNQAVAAIFAAKNRPTFTPLIVHVADMETAETLVTFTPEARLLAQAFWPGPMTLVLPKRADTPLCDLVTAGLDTVGIRVPAHPLAQELLRKAGLPIAAPSANPSGKISPTTAAHVMAGLETRIAAVLDGGACAVGVESTIFGGDPVTLLRPGGIPLEAAEKALGRSIKPAKATASPTAPGQLASHYAPEAAITLDVQTPGDAPHLGFGPGAADLNLSEQGDLVEAAANLFALLREMDALAAASDTKRFTVAPIPDTGLGQAIRDRLHRAAAPRP